MAILSDYIGEALERAVYEKLEDGTYCGEVPELVGVIAFAPTLAACERELKSVIEGWILLGLNLGHPIPSLKGIDLTQNLGALESVQP